MKTDINGICQCTAGEEQYEKFANRGIVFFQYDYRSADGRMFSIVRRSLDLCRSERDRWLREKVATGVHREVTYKEKDNG